MGKVNMLGVSCKHGGKSRVAQLQAVMAQAVREITKHLMKSLFFFIFLSSLATCNSLVS